MALTELDRILELARAHCGGTASKIVDARELLRRDPLSKADYQHAVTLIDAAERGTTFIAAAISELRAALPAEPAE